MEFVVHELRVSGDRAIASVQLQLQRPGGKLIDIQSTPGYVRGEVSTDMMDGTLMQALYVRSGQIWVVIEHAIGATDVWYEGEPFSSSLRAVIAEVCY